MRLRLRTLMIGVMVAAVVSAAAVFVRDVLRSGREGDGLNLVMLGFAGLFLIAVPFAAWHTIGLTREDDARDPWHRRVEDPGRFPPPPPEVGPPE